MTDPTVLVQKVADVIPRRATEGNGLAGGTFDTTTSPTGAQVTRISANYLQDVASRVGVAGIPDDFTDRAEDVAAIGAAAQIELSFFPEQGTSISDALFKRYDQALVALVGEIEAATGTDAPGGTGLAAGGFGSDCDDDLSRLLSTRPLWVLGLPDAWPYPHG